MAANFKCCRTKEQPNLYCLLCKNVFHRSCWKRSSNNFTVIRDNLIFCSKDCEDRANGVEPEIIDDLRDLIRQTKIELDEKTAHIARLKRSSLSFAEEAANTENEYLMDIDKQRTIISELRKKINNLETEKHCNNQEHVSTSTQTTIAQENVYTQTRIKRKHFTTQTNDGYILSNLISTESQTEIKLCNKASQTIDIHLDSISEDVIKVHQLTLLNNDLKEQIRNMDKVRLDMLARMESLLEENNTYATEIRTMKQNVLHYANNTYIAEHGVPKITEQTCVKNNVSDCALDNNNRYSVKKKVLIMGDDSARHSALMLNSLLDSSLYKVEGFVQPDAPLVELTRSIFNASTRITQDDHAVIFLNFNKYSFFSSVDIKNILALGRFTNLILCCKYNLNSYKQKAMLDKIRQLLSYHRNVSVRMIENFKEGHNYRHAVRPLCRLLSSYIKNRCNQSQIALVSVPCVNQSSETKYSAPVALNLSCNQITEDILINDAKTVEATTGRTNYAAAADQTNNNVIEDISFLAIQKADNSIT